MGEQSTATGKQNGDGDEMAIVASARAQAGV